MSFAVGDKLQGKVTGITKFGAFVELPGGVTGLVHISEVAENYVQDINNHLKLNDIVTVKVIQMDANGKIGLSIRKAVDRPVRSEHHHHRREGRNHGSGHDGEGRTNFEDKVSRFLKDSEERISSLRKNTDAKRGGRGGRRD